MKLAELHAAYVAATSSDSDLRARVVAAIQVLAYSIKTGDGADADSVRWAQGLDPELVAPQVLWDVVTDAAYVADVDDDTLSEIVARALTCNGIQTVDTATMKSVVSVGLAAKIDG